MQRKMINLIEMWGKEGYEIKGRSTQSSPMELKLSFRRADLQPTLLHKEWDTIKALASRQDFYALPVSDGGHSGTPEVLLVQKELIYQMQHSIQPILKELKESYWFIQGVTQLVYFKNLGDILWKAMVVMNQDVRQMKSMDDTAHVRYYFEECQPHKQWVEYLESVREWTEDIKDCEQISDEIKDNVTKLGELYAYE